ncbi:hypothetical protein NEOKW01_0241 [Nematocida sp. AWRm80]|nr:hypothetical protein NEOKW01_0241 [Nematocida sp. AWRm80]
MINDITALKEELDDKIGELSDIINPIDIESLGDHTKITDDQYKQMKVPIIEINVEDSTDPIQIDLKQSLSKTTMKMLVEHLLYNSNIISNPPAKPTLNDINPMLLTVFTPENLPALFKDIALIQTERYNMCNDVAVTLQDRVTDYWNFYKSIKDTINNIDANILGQLSNDSLKKIEDINNRIDDAAKLLRKVNAIDDLKVSLENRKKALITKYNLNDEGYRTMTLLFVSSAHNTHSTTTIGKINNVTNAVNNDGSLLEKLNIITETDRQVTEYEEATIVAGEEVNKICLNTDNPILYELYRLRNHVYNDGYWNTRKEKYQYTNYRLFSIAMTILAFICFIILTRMTCSTIEATNIHGGAFNMLHADIYPIYTIGLTVLGTISLIISSFTEGFYIYGARNHMNPTVFKKTISIITKKSFFLIVIPIILVVFTGFLRLYRPTPFAVLIEVIAALGAFFVMSYSFYNSEDRNINTYIDEHFTQLALTMILLSSAIVLMTLPLDFGFFVPTTALHNVSKVATIAS